MIVSSDDGDGGVGKAIKVLVGEPSLCFGADGVKGRIEPGGRAPTC